MSGFQNPAFTAFISEIKNELILAQLLVARKEIHYELRHIADRNRAVQELNKISLADVRALVDFTASGQFRPLKSAPNLRGDWYFLTDNESELELVLNQFYPNAIADWFAARNETLPVTNYREFTARQTGMYRIATMLDDVQAADVIRACCNRKFCLKQRLWTVPGLPTDLPAEKSMIPCLEPCAILLEFARKGMRIEQEERMTVSFSPGDAASLKAAFEIALENPKSGIREADFNAPENPRRLQLVLEKLNSSGITLANVPQRE